MTKLMIMRGLPASGKSTWANDWVAEDMTGRVRINRDSLRDMIHNGEYRGRSTELTIMRARDALIASFLRKGMDVVVDDTNLPSATVRGLMKIAADVSPLIQVEIKDLTDVPLETCIERDAKRYDGANSRACVGENVIRGMHDRYLKGKSHPLPLPTLAPTVVAFVEPYVAKPGTPKAVLVDIDGTVALMGDRNPYDESCVDQDKPNPRVVELVKLLAYDRYYPIFMSGRSRACEDATVAWLDAQGFSNYHLYMRNVSDTRKDAVVKLELFNEHVRDHYDVRLVLDDRDQVVELWRSLGLTCLQVAEGNF
jgi:predicted kinase